MNDSGHPLPPPRNRTRFVVLSVVGTIASVALIVYLLMSSSGSGTPQAGGTLAPTVTTPTPPTTGSTETTSPANQGWCQVPFPEEVLARMKDFWSSSSKRSVIPFDSTGPGTVVVAEVTGPKFNGIALVQAADGTVLKKIRAFPTGKLGQALGAFDGRYAVWTEHDYPQNLAGFRVEMWDRKTGKVTQVGRDGRYYGDPVMSDGFAAWGVLGDTIRDKGAIVVLNLKTGKQYVARRGYVTLVALASGSVFWGESRRAGGKQVVKALDVKSRQPASVPSALQSAGVAPVVHWGDSWAWTDRSDHRDSLYYSPDGEQVELVVTLQRHDGFSPPLALSGGLLSLAVTNQGLILANTSTGAYSLVPEASFATAFSEGLLVQPSWYRMKSDPKGLAPIPLTASDLTAVTCNG